jgi:virginiamycin B lyase
MNKRLLSTLALVVPFAALLATLATAAPLKKPLPAAKGLRLTATISVPGSPGAPVVGFGSIWAPLTDNAGVARIDPATRKVVERIGIQPALAGYIPGSTYDETAIGDGSVWAASDTFHLVSRIDPETNELLARIPVDGRPGTIAFAAGSVWVGEFGGSSVTRIDPASNKIVARFSAGSGGVVGLAGDDTQVWALLTTGPTLVRIDPATNKPVKRVSVKAPGKIVGGYLTAWGAALSETGDVWVGNQAQNEVTRVNTKTAKVTKHVVFPLGRQPFYIAAGGGSVWVVNDSYLFRISARTGNLVGWARFPKAKTSGFTGVAFGAGAAWVTNYDRNQVYRFVVS